MSTPQTFFFPFLSFSFGYNCEQPVLAVPGGHVIGPNVAGLLYSPYGLAAGFFFSGC